MKTTTTKRRIVKTAANAGGLAARKSAMRIGHPGEPKRPRKRPTRAAPGTTVHPQLKRILVPVDFSPASLRAVRFARDWAIRFRASVCLLHVAEPINTAASFGAEAVLLAPLPPGFRDKARVELEKLARKEFPRSTKVSAQLREGVAFDEIVSAARKLKSDIIIIAAHGRSALMRVLIGSTAERVVRHAPCPVLTLRIA